jgi:hypothetical protein
VPSAFWFGSLPAAASGVNGCIPSKMPPAFAATGTPAHEVPVTPMPPAKPTTPK